MDALEFAKQKRRMCNLYYREEIGCCDCPLNFTELCSIGDNVLKLENDAEIISTVEKWAAEHPEKTREDEFLTMFPNAHMKNGHIDICPQAVDTSLKCLHCDRLRNVQERCKICIEKFWLAPLEG